MKKLQFSNISKSITALLLITYAPAAPQFKPSHSEENFQSTPSTPIPATPQILSRDYQLVVNSQTKENDSSKATIKKILLGKKKNWSDGKAIALIIYKDNPIQKHLIKELTSKSLKSFLTYWKKMIFTGKGRAPCKVKDVHEMLRMIKATKGAIGFIPVNTQLPKGVKELVIKE